jgi:hypothetical protein
MIDLPGLKVYNMSTIESGIWTVSVSSNGRPYSATVTARSSVFFIYQIATGVNDSHSGFAEISGNPLTGNYRKKTQIL